MRTVVVTGASGLVGRHLCDRFRREGWAVRAMMRHVDDYPFREQGIERFHLDLPRALDVSAFRGADVVVHCAYGTRATTETEARGVNEEGAAAVFAAARAAAVRVVFMSSLSASTDATSYYARSKRLVEGLLDPGRDLIVRAGLVLAADGGLARRLWGAIARYHVAPVLNAGRQIVQTVHVDDLSTACVRGIEGDLSGLVHVAEAEGLAMRQLLESMAQSIDATCVFIPVRAGALLAGLRALERFGIGAPMSSDSVLGLLALRHVDVAADVARLSLRPRPAAQSIAELAPSVRARLS